jgi:hypothetical protein
MNPRTLTWIFAITLLTTLHLPGQTAAEHGRYKLIDLGTLGGPNSQVNGTPPPMINNRGVVAGLADTAEPCSYLDGFVSPAFRWQKGVLTNLGLLPGRFPLAFQDPKSGLSSKVQREIRECP